jgi:hypothetical protein
VETQRLLAECEHARRRLLVHRPVNAAGSSTIDFSYAPAGAKVYVMTDAGVSNAVAYKLLDPVTMQIDALLLCTYRRVG